MAEKHIQDRAREMRAKPMNGERLLWARLRKRQLCDMRFRRQHPIGVYIVDFVCLSQRLVIEVDGDQHCEPDAKAHDARRDGWLTGEGYRVLRFSTREIYDEIDVVVAEIWRALQRGVSGGAPASDV